MCVCVHQEVQPDLVEPIDLNDEIQQVEDLQDGDIVCFQKYATLTLMDGMIRAK